MPDKDGRIPPVSLGKKGKESWERIFGKKESERPSSSPPSVVERVDVPLADPEKRKHLTRSFDHGRLVG